MATEWYEALDRDLDANKRRVPMGVMAGKINKAVSTLYAKSEGRLPLNFEEFGHLCEVIQPTELVAWVCRKARCYWAPMPPVDASIDTQLPALLGEFGDVVKSLGDAMADGRVTPEEAAQVRLEAEQLITALFGVVMVTERLATTIPLRPQTIAEAQAKENGGAA